MQNELMFAMITEQIAKLGQNIARTIACEISALRSLVQCNSEDIDQKLCALEGRILSAMVAPAGELNGIKNENKPILSIDTTRGKFQDGGGKHTRIFEIGASEGTLPFNQQSRARNNVANKSSAFIINPSETEIESSCCEINEMGKTGSKDSSRQKIELSFRHGRSSRRTKDELEISTSPHIEQDTIISVSRSLNDAPAHTALCPENSTEQQPAAPGPAADSDQCPAASDPADIKLDDSTCTSPTPPADNLSSATRNFALAVASTTGSARTLIPREDSAIYQPDELKRKVPACICCGGADAPRRCVPSCVDKALRAMLEAVFGISDPNIWVGSPGSSLIHPNSPFSTGRLRERTHRGCCGIGSKS